MRKGLLLAGVGLILIIGLFVVGSLLSNDQIRPRLDNVYSNNSQVVEICNQDLGKLSNFDLKIAASNLAAVITTHNLLLSNYYQDRYRTEPLESQTETAFKRVAEAEGEQFGEAFKQQIHDLLFNNIETLKQINQTTKRDELKELTSKLLSELTELINQLN